MLRDNSFAAWEATHDKTERSWDYYEIWLTVLEQMVQRSGLIDQSGQASSQALRYRIDPAEPQRASIQRPKRNR